MKRIVLFFLLLMCYTGVYADPINKIVYFGDSLTDNGNLYNVSLRILPKSPPYYEGRFSNGPVWSDIVSQFYQNKYNIPSDNFSVGGATAVFRTPFEGKLPYCLDQEMNHYIFQTIFRDRKHALYVIWIGANDYTEGQKNVEGATSSVVNKIISNVNRLIGYGAHHFLIMNLPDLSRAPYAKDQPFLDNVHELTITHNKKLDAAIADLKKSHPDVQITYFDVFTIFNIMQDDIEVFNKKYNKFIKNTNEPCWNGGYSLAKSTQAEVDGLRTQLMKTMIPAADAQNMAEHLLSSPDTAEAYRVERLAAAGGKSCEFPDTYAFWDKVHPTRVIHEIMGNLIIEKLLEEKITGTN
ncbi:MAG: SGNH/GDSL hydrolase family protein [Gammaproteobacteria bacterium]